MTYVIYSFAIFGAAVFVFLLIWILLEWTNATRAGKYSNKRRRSMPSRPPIVRENHLLSVASFQRRPARVLKLPQVIRHERMARDVVRPGYFPILF